MIKYSHVSLIILCSTPTEADAITAELEVDPSRINESKSQSWSPDTGRGEKTSWSWMLDSPKSHDEADVPERLWALADIIEPFAERLRTLKSSYHPWVDAIYHNTPQHPHGFTGEFHWIRMPADLMRRFANWDLSISYEVFWFDHPEWVKPKSGGWFSQIKRRLNKLGRG